MQITNEKQSKKTGNPLTDNLSDRDVSPWGSLFVECDVKLRCQKELQNFFVIGGSLESP